MPDQVAYRCIEPSCARTMPRRVEFCPYCGLDQRARPNSQQAVFGPGDAVADAKADERPPALAQERVRAAAGEVGNDGRGRNAADGSRGPTRWAATSGKSAAPVAPRLPQRQPIRLRWWLLALLVLWMTWFVAKHSSTRKLDARIERAIVLAEQCKSREAQSELAALRSKGATPAKLQRLQEALDEAAGECRRMRQRGKSTGDAGDARSLAGAIDGVARPRVKLNRRGSRRSEEQ
ncbi:hypothetical protein [Massilia horti]|uniref:Uncharacterized protein n=1 Tax=Massilia horti TaxID=2562153 RepID=A0A4Y9SP44_9BURK|nr:hypothetical protein [Massilia horti]TFW28502.1 hypothetical protein E4O92_21065 [Massilia horti]